VDVFDEDGDDLTVSFYNAADHSLINTDIVFGGTGTASVTWSGLLIGTSYTWYAISDDGLNVTQSATWSFTTNKVPNVPTNPTPNDDATGISYSPTLSVDVLDDDGDDLIVSFYNAADHSLINTYIVIGGSGTASVTWSGLSSGTSYSWYVIADDGLSLNQSATWLFTTNHVPDDLTNPTPNDGAIDISYNPTLSVDVFDEDGDDLTVSFYNAADHSLINIDIVFGGTGTASVTWSGLSIGTSYTWYAISDDGISTNQSTTWSFTTNYAPNEPTNPTPIDGATVVTNILTLLSVDVSDDDGDDITVTFYDASDDSVINIDIITGGSGTASVEWTEALPGTTYSWYAISDDGLSTTQSSTWTFETNDESAPPPPSTPPGIPGFSLVLPILIGTVTVISVRVYLKRKKIA